MHLDFAWGINYAQPSPKYGDSIDQAAAWCYKKNDGKVCFFFDKYHKNGPKADF